MSNEFRKVRNLPILFNMLGKPERFIKDFSDLEVERVLKAEKVLKTTIAEVKTVSVEQEIVFRNERYIVNHVEEGKNEDGLKSTKIEAHSAFVELGTRTKSGKFTVVTKTVASILEDILEDTEWSVGVVEVLGDEDPLVSLDEENATILSLITLLTDVTDYESDFDTLNKKVNMRVNSGRHTNEVIRYRNNLRSITRTIEPPRATVIFPRGRDGITIESVNNGEDFLENYSYYTDTLGVPLELARVRFRKDYIFKDDRVLYEGNLKTIAKREIDRLSKPMVSYSTTVGSLNDKDIKEGDYLYVIDEDLGIKEETRVVRIVDKLFREYENDIELNYLQEDLGSMQDNSGGASGDGNKENFVYGRNEVPVIIPNYFSDIVELAVTTSSSSNLMLYVTMVLNANSNSLLEFYIKVSGDKITQVFKQTVRTGYETVTIAIPLLQFPEGSRFVALTCKADGFVSADVGEIQVTLKGSSVLGGESEKPPKVDVVEDVTYKDVLNSYVVTELIQNDFEEEGED